MSDALSRLRRQLEHQRYAGAGLIAVENTDLREVLDILDAAEKDAGRLDALERAPNQDVWIVAKGIGSFTVHLARGQHATRATLREAIDAAISARASTAGDAL